MSAPGQKRRAAKSRDNWETPQDLYDVLNDEFRFTLDAAADDTNHKAERWIEGPCVRPIACSNEPPCSCPQCLASPCFCGLCSDVLDNRVWCNPPYGEGLTRWVHAFERWSAKGALVVALLPNATDTAWFAELYNGAHEIRLLCGRVPFVGSTSGNPSGSIIAIYRPERRAASPHVWLWRWNRAVLALRIARKALPPMAEIEEAA